MSACLARRLVSHITLRKLRLLVFHVVYQPQTTYPHWLCEFAIFGLQHTFVVSENSYPTFFYSPVSHENFVAFEGFSVSASHTIGYSGNEVHHAYILLPLDLIWWYQSLFGFPSSLTRALCSPLLNQWGLT